MSHGPWEGRRLHFVGIGGAGMSGLALVARELGAAVTGSDRAESSYLVRLRAAGVEPQIGHAAAALPAAAEVVVSTAIPADNPELVAARAAGATVIHRGDLLAEVASLKRSVAVAGTHGKTTTASMVAHVLLAAGRDPAYLIGGELRTTGANAGWGGGDWIVVEADESDRSFLALRPTVALVTNVELDHHATYASLAEVEDAFRRFATASARTVAGAPVRAVVGADVTFGFETDADVRATDASLGPSTRFTALGTRFELRTPGRHNVLNALAAIGACREIGVSPAEVASALTTFAGARRRFEWRGRTPAGAEVYDDYAHHPTELAATLEAARTLAPKRLVACFQPHLYSRTRELAAAFGAALALADLAVVVDVYPARERAADFPGVSGLVVVEAARAAGAAARWAPTLADAAGLLHAELREGDLLLTLGAGDVDTLAGELVAGG